MWITMWVEFLKKQLASEVFILEFRLEKKMAILRYWKNSSRKWTFFLEDANRFSRSLTRKAAECSYCYVLTFLENVQEFLLEFWSEKRWLHCNTYYETLTESWKKKSATYWPLKFWVLSQADTIITQALSIWT